MSQQQIDLGAASDFAVLGAATVTNTGPSDITGDLGVSPGTAITGFPPGNVTDGTTEAGSAKSAAAHSALTTAYNEAAGRTTGSVSISGNLGGMTLTPGLYTSTAGFAVSSGDLTLDGQGSPSSVFVFQMASTLGMSAGRQMVLTNGASANNVFWQVGSSATFGVGSVAVGNILAYASITVTTGVQVTGRLLALTGAVTLDSNTIVKPAVAAPVVSADAALLQLITGVEQQHTSWSAFYNALTKTTVATVQNMKAHSIDIVRPGDTAPYTVSVHGPLYNVTFNGTKEFQD